MSYLEIKNERAWWSTNPKYDTIQIPSGGWHSSAAKKFLTAHGQEYKSDRDMEVYDFIRAWKSNNVLYLEGSKKSIKKILPNILKYARSEPDIYDIVFDYYTEESSGEKKYKSYTFEISNPSIIKLRTAFEHVIRN